MYNVTLWHIQVTTVATEMQQWVPFLLLTYICHCQHYVEHIAMKMQQRILFSIAVDLKTFCHVYTSLDIQTG
jgi:hypothetical protein